MNRQNFLKDYFDRIGYTADPKADLNTLADLHLLHNRTFAFENLNPLLKIPVELDIDSLKEKMLYQHRGGYCFEQNLLFINVLKSLGYQVRGLLGRVISQNPERMNSRTHMLLLIDLNGKNFIADTGFGGRTLTGPIELKTEITQKTPHEDFRILHSEEGYLLQSCIKNEWKDLYEFSLQKQYPVDFKLANWYTSTHTDSHFTSNLMAAIAGSNCRYGMINNRFSTHYLEKESDLEILNNVKEIKEVLTDVFKIRLPENPRLDEVLEGVIRLAEEE